MKKSLIWVPFIVGALAACQSVNSQSVKSMPTGYLCDLLSPTHITLTSERRAIFEELERRGAECVDKVEVKVREADK